MERADRIYVAGHRGLVGSAILRRLEALGYSNLTLRSHSELELLDALAVSSFFEEQRIDYVFLAAAKAGGIYANDTYPADFFYQNVALQTNVIHAAWRSGVNRLLFLGSSCIYPRDCPQPIKESYILTGPLEPTNRAYAVAKLAGVEMCWSYNRQHGTRFLAAMPTNLYGPGDNFDSATSHVIPALMRRMHEAKEEKRPSVTVWGSGTPRREFLHSDDLADACVWLMNLPDREFSNLCASTSSPPTINIGCGEDQSIADLAVMVAQVVGYRGELVFDRSKPDGTPRKLLDVSRLRELGWKPRIGLREGMERAYEGFLRRFAQAVI